MSSGAGVSRRTALQGAAAALLATVLRPSAAGASGVRPNVLVLMSEDCGAYHLGCYGGRARTPNIDALAASGVRWAQCFSAAPVCAPSRAALITGVPPESCGPAHHMRAEGRAPEALEGLGWPALLRRAGYHCTNNVKTDYNLPIDLQGTWDGSRPTAHWRDRPAGKPFFAVFNPQMTHEVSVVQATALEQVAGGTVTTPYLPADAVEAYVGLPIVGGPTHPRDVRIPPYLQDSPTTRQDAAKYLNVVHQMDAAIGRRLTELEADGLADDTIVLYTSDHAGVLPRSKRFCYDSGLHVPLVARFGRNVAHLAPGPPGTMIRSPVNSGTDLPATVLDCTVGRRPRHVRGSAFAGPRRRRRRYAFAMRNRMDERYDMQRTVRDERFRYIRNYHPHVPYGQHIQFLWLQAGMREWEHLYRRGKLGEVQSRFWRPKPAEELYDLRRDRDEVRNLAGDPAHRRVLRRLRAALDQHILAVRDNGFLPEGSPLQGYDVRDPAAYPLPRVLRLANHAIRRDPAYAPTLARLLGDDVEVMRFWAALGCSMLGRRADRAEDALRRALDRDPSTVVRVAAAEALARLGDHGDPVAYLGERLVQDPSTWVRLQAANALDQIGPGARGALPQLLQAAADLRTGQAAEPYVAQAARHTALRLAGVTLPIP